MHIHLAYCRKKELFGKSIRIIFYRKEITAYTLYSG